MDNNHIKTYYLLQVQHELPRCGPRGFLHQFLSTHGHHNSKYASHLNDHLVDFHLAEFHHSEYIYEGVCLSCVYLICLVM